MRQLTLVFLVVAAPALAKSNFDSLSVAKFGSEKCNTDASIVLLPYRITAECSQNTGSCSGEVRLPLNITGSSCRPRGTVSFERAAAYLTGWFSTAQTWPSAPDSWVHQLHELSFQLRDQFVDATANELVAKFEVIARGTAAPEYFAPELRIIEARVEVVAVDPLFNSSVSLEFDSQIATSPGTSAVSNKIHTSPTGLDFAFVGLTRFDVKASQGLTPKGSEQGVNIERLELATIPTSPAAGSVSIDLRCTLEGNRPGIAQTTSCRSDVVAVFSDRGLLSRPTIQPRLTLVVPEALDPARKPFFIAGPTFPGWGACALVSFSFQRASFPSFFKPSALGAGVNDCESPFKPGGSPFLVLANGHEVRSTGAPDQQPYSVCPPPPGVGYTCASTSWLGEFWLDAAILP